MLRQAYRNRRTPITTESDDAQPVLTTGADPLKQRQSDRTYFH